MENVIEYLEKVAVKVVEFPQSSGDYMRGLENKVEDALSAVNKIKNKPLPDISHLKENMKSLESISEGLENINNMYQQSKKNIPSFNHRNAKIMGVSALGIGALAAARKLYNSHHDGDVQRKTASWKIPVGAGAGLGTLNIMKQLGEVRSGRQEKVDPYRVGRSAVVGAAMGAGGQAIAKNAPVIKETIKKYVNESTLGKLKKNIEATAQNAEDITKNVEGITRKAKNERGFGMLSKWRD